MIAILASMDEKPLKRKGSLPCYDHFACKGFSKVNETPRKAPFQNGQA